MRYDPLFESRRMIRDGAPDEFVKLTRRRRWLPVAVDVDGDAAVTAFLRRGVSGDACMEHWVLTRRDGDWELLGGGGGNGYRPELPDRPSAAELGTLVRLDGTGWTVSNPERLFPWGARGVSNASLTVAAEVERLRVVDRHVEVPRHGIMVVVWKTRRPPPVIAVGADGSELARVDAAALGR